MSLSILVVVPPWFPVPPKGYGGVEAVCDSLIRALVSKGHRVEVAGGGGSELDVPVHTAYSEPLPLRINESIVDVRHAMMVEDVLESSQFDVVHDHTLMGPWLAAKRPEVSLTTVHNALSEDYLSYTERVSATASLVGVSQFHIDGLPSIDWLDFVHNGVATERFPYVDRDSREEWVLYLGRSIRTKGMHTAIDAARIAGRKIVLAAKCNEPFEKKYFAEYIEPRLGPGVEWLGEVDFKTKAELLGRATCLLNPIAWQEPFGLVMAEAQACGTPVVALDQGSCSEVVLHGETGWLCDSTVGLASGIEEAEGMSSSACRLRAVTHFDENVMADSYERLYLKLLAAR